MRYVVGTEVVDEPPCLVVEHPPGLQASAEGFLAVTHISQSALCSTGWASVDGGRSCADRVWGFNAGPSRRGCRWAVSLMSSAGSRVGHRVRWSAVGRSGGVAVLCAAAGAGPIGRAVGDVECLCDCEWSVVAVERTAGMWCPVDVMRAAGVRLCVRLPLRCRAPWWSYPPPGGFVLCTARGGGRRRSC